MNFRRIENGLEIILRPSTPETQTIGLGRIAGVLDLSEDMLYRLLCQKRNHLLSRSNGRFERQVLVSDLEEALQFIANDVSTALDFTAEKEYYEIVHRLSRDKVQMIRVQRARH